MPRHRTLSALLLVIAACHAPGSRGEPPPYEVLVEGYQSGTHHAGATLITTPDEWQAFWRQHTSWRIPAAPEPQVDFQVHSVIVICAGDEPTAGWTLETQSVTHAEGKLRVQAVLRAPAADAVLPQVVTQPYQILLVARTSGEVVLDLAQR